MGGWYRAKAESLEERYARDPLAATKVGPSLSCLSSRRKKSPPSPLLSEFRTKSRKLTRNLARAALFLPVTLRQGCFLPQHVIQPKVGPTQQPAPLSKALCAPHCDPAWPLLALSESAAGRYHLHLPSPTQPLHPNS